MGGPLENQLLITLGLSLLIENGLLLFFGAEPQLGRMPGDTGVPLFGAVAHLPACSRSSAPWCSAALLYVLLRRTRLGTAIRAVAANRPGAQLVGIDDAPHLHADVRDRHRVRRRRGRRSSRRW